MMNVTNFKVPDIVEILIDLWELPEAWRHTAAGSVRSGAILPPAAGSAHLSSFTLPQLCALWLPEVSVKVKEKKKTVLEKKSEQYFYW